MLEAANGAEALEVSKRSSTIDLLLTDIIMPGISGRALAQKLCESRSQMKVIFMSGYTGQTIGVQSTFDPGTNFLQKPFKREGLARKVKEVLKPFATVV